VALAVLPSVAARILHPARRASAGAGLTSRYVSALRRSLRRPGLVAGAASIFIVGGVLLSGQLGTGFLPEADEGSYIIDYSPRWVPR